MMAVFCTYGALVFFLVCGSCSSVREARPAKRAPWAPVKAEEFPYLALVKTGPDTCAGSIPSASTVLTYCPTAAEGSEAYAGLLDVGEAKPSPTGANIQFREVEKVDKYSNTHLKMCFLKTEWTLDAHVNVVPLHLNEKSALPQKTCTVLGFGPDPTVNTKIVAHKLVEQTIGGSEKCGTRRRNLDNLLYSRPAAAEEKLGTQDVGGPAVCDDKEQWGISMTYKATAPQAPSDCNLYIDIAKYREWIEEQKNGESGVSGGTGGNSTSPSSGYSIHSYLSKYSNWKVLLLCLIIIKFLVY